MYSHRNLDIALATIIAILGGLAAAKHMPGQVTVPLGVGLFFAPGYLWSQAILGQRLQGVERAMTTAGMALVFPILGGFLFYALHIPLFRPDWVGMLVVLTLLGVVAVAIQRLREAPADRPQQARRDQRPRQHGSLVLNSFVFALAGLIGVGAIGYSVKSAEAQKFSAYTSLWTSPIVNDSALRNMNALAGNAALQQTAAQAVNRNQQKATQASVMVTNDQGATEQYRLNLLEKGKVTKTWNFTLNDGQSWHTVIPWTYKYSMVTALYMLPDLTKYLHCDDNGPTKYCTGA